MLSDQFIEILNQECQVKPGMPILVGVSGGADSICLLDLFQKSGYPILIAHFNHKLRNEAEDDLFFVKKNAALRGLPFVQGEGDVRDYAKRNRKTLEEAARICRYDFLMREAIKKEISIVAVAHTATDQAETILMHILRGCGLDGLQGMLSVSLLNDSPHIRLIRPLLSFWKRDILNYCENYDLEFRDDQTNFDPGYFRNRLRLKLMPILKEYNPNVEKHLNNLGKISHRELRLIHQSLRRSYQQCLIEETTTYINLSRTALLKVENGMLQRVLQFAFRKLTGGSIELNFDMMERITRFVRTTNKKNHLSLPAFYELIIEGNYVYIHHRKSALPSQGFPFMDPELEVNIDVPAEVKVNSKLMVKTSFITVKDIEFSKGTSSLIFKTFLDAKKIARPLKLKCQQPGLKFEPLGLQGKTQKLSDFWINKKIPRRFRSSWPLLFNGEEIAWIPGFQPGHKYKITDETRTAVKIEFTAS